MLKTPKISCVKGGDTAIPVCLGWLGQGRSRNIWQLSGKREPAEGFF